MIVFRNSTIFFFIVSMTVTVTVVDLEFLRRIALFVLCSLLNSFNYSVKVLIFTWISWTLVVVVDKVVLNVVTCSTISVTLVFKVVTTFVMLVIVFFDLLMILFTVSVLSGASSPSSVTMTYACLVSLVNLLLKLLIKTFTDFYSYLIDTVILEVVFS